MICCTGCGESKDRDAYCGSLGYNCCRECRANYARARKARLIANPPPCCSSCGMEKPAHEMQPGHTRCRVCVRAADRASKAKARAAPKQVPTHKHCRGCGEVRPAADFHRHLAHRDGLATNCKACGNAPRAKFSHARAQAKARQIGFSLTFDQFSAFWGRPCVYCGDAIDTVRLDRVDSARGYEADNVVPCCWMCNQAKHERSVADFLAWIARVHRHSVAAR